MIYNEKVEHYSVNYTLVNGQVVFVDGCLYQGQPVDLNRDRNGEWVYDEIMDRL